jgi:hypothetical protein
MARYAYRWQSVWENPMKNHTMGAPPLVRPTW